VRYETDDLRIAAINPLIPPAILMEELPVSEAGSETVSETRRLIGACLCGDDQRLVVVVGPCSIHDTKTAVEYAERLREQADRLAQDLLIVMRVYFEKPRTNVGWKGLINDPFIDGSFSINKGLRMARGLLCQLADLKMPAGCEFLDTIMPQFLADLVSWGAIGARTTESQVHRELASGMSCPMGFKNGTHGSIQVAVDAIEAARHAHHFLSVTKQSVAAIVSTHGNAECHVIMRGGNEGPNYDIDSLTRASALLQQHGLNPRLMVDCSHGNSEKIPAKQIQVAAALAEHIASPASPVFGVMIESNLVGGRQSAELGQELVHGQSITDACLGWEDTAAVLETLASAVSKRA
jgi:3-deoxy-7-phosphoheptulonate synthase